MVISDVKLGAEPLKIGPIGVPPQKQEKFTLPGDWYDDDEENERKEAEGKEEGDKEEENQEVRGKDKEAKEEVIKEGGGKTDEEKALKDSPKNMKSGVSCLIMVMIVAVFCLGMTMFSH